MPLTSVVQYLEQNQMPYTIIEHPEAFTAQETAHHAHISGHLLAKTVVLMIEGKMAMVVLPASHRVNLAHLRQELGCNRARLANEMEFEKAFPTWELGALAPFGNLYGIDVHLSKILAERDQIVFCIGNHHQLIRMATCDYIGLVHPLIITTV